MIDKLWEKICSNIANSFDTGYQGLHETFVGENWWYSVVNFQTQNITEGICHQLTEFTSPVYLALFDESERLNSDPDLTKLLLNVSVALNSTLEMARYLVSYHKPRFSSST